MFDDNKNMHTKCAFFLGYEIFERKFIDFEFTTQWMSTSNAD